MSRDASAHAHVEKHEQRVERHEQIDRELRAIARRRAGLEAEEARWLREAERLRIWRKLGYSTALEYLEDVFGYSPRTAKDRLRVARELGALPGLETQLRDGMLPYSAARELTRVMTPGTEAAWLARARGRNLRDIEDLVSGHARGDSPDAPKNPDLMTRRVTFELTPRVDALLQQARAMFEVECGEYIEDADFIEALCRTALAYGTDGLFVEIRAAADTATAADARVSADTDGTAVDTATAADTRASADTDGTAAARTPAVATKAPRPAYRNIIRTCDRCSRVELEGRGRLVGLTASERELAACDAETVREADIVAAANAGTRRPAPTLTIPTKVRDLVWTRDGGRCRVPGCRATRHVAFHHLEHRAHGGEHTPANLILICDGHHKAAHDGLLTIGGTAADQLVFTRNGKRLVDARSPGEERSTRELHAVRKHALASGGANERRPRAANDEAASGSKNRFADVVKLEQAKQALLQLGFKPRAARQALDAACAHVGTDATVAALVEQALALTRPDPATDLAAQTVDQVGETTMRAMAKQALVQSGYSAGVAERAVEAACAHVGTETDLATLIAEAFRRCASHS